MNKLRRNLTVAALTIAMTAMAQPGQWDREKYPDLPSPHPTVDRVAAQRLIKRMKQSIAAGHVRPDHVNNALLPSFPPIINQSGGSCGAASSIYYQFTHQINTARFVAADTDERRYATHFPWMLNTNSPNGTGYDRLGKDVGIASCATYGGTTYSRIYGRSSQDDQDDDCGWMQGYDRWFATMHNRIASGNSFPFNCGTEEGREIVKNYLWNRCGDESYAGGGICGIGVAAGPFEGVIPKTAANDAAGVTGMKYITDWNETYNHAMTIVGYDDRVEVDLDGNGVVGEERNADGDNEVGAWIICNSWGDGYANNGFIYCPYERSNSVKGWPKSNSFTPGYYEVMRDYRPIRTLRVKMDYSRRSEMALYVGAAQDLNATAPEKSISLTHFEYCGDGNKGQTRPAPEIPMLGRWADGELHTEPMEFGYDLTALTKDFDHTRPLKYFFWVETRAWGEGEGHIYEASIIDYTFDRNGVEVAFPIDEPVAVPSAGAKTEITAVISGEAVPEPRNLLSEGTSISWEAPAGSRHEPTSYKVYRNGSLYGSASSTTAAVEAGGCYTVTAIYHVNGYDIESKPSSPVAVTSQTADDTGNDIMFVDKGKIVIHNLIKESITSFTLEFWTYLAATSTGESCGFRMRADTTTYFFKIINNGYFELGNDGGSYTRSSTRLVGGRLYHIAIVNEELETRVYVNGRRVVKWSNRYNHHGIKGPASLTFGVTEGTTTNYKQVYDAPWRGYLDEIRFWDCARTEQQIKDAYQMDIAHPMIYDDLLHYYNMSTRLEDGTTFLVDGKGVSDAELSRADAFSFEHKDLGDEKNPLKSDTYADFSCADVVTLGKPFAITNLSALNTARWQWQFTGTDVDRLEGTVSPVVVFNQAGPQTVTLTTTNAYGETAEKTTTVNVQPAVLPTVDFTVPEGDISAGQHITFVNTSTPIEAATYEWDIEGAEHPVVKSVNAAATFTENGEYTVRLTAYNSEGNRSVTKTVSVGAVAPQAAFSINDNIILKGQQVELVDDSKFSPSQWTWDLANNLEIYRIEGQHRTVTLNVPGVYDVTLTAVNAKGADRLTRKRAVVVCNDDGKHGLHLDGIDDQVTAPSPFGDEPAKAFTVDWWMFPGRITDNGFHIGDNASTMQICVKPTGELSLDINGKNVTSERGGVIFDEWHHYAITFRAGTVNFYRDAQLLSSARLSGASALPVLQQFTIGGSERPFNGIIDELRVWSSVITAANMLATADAPVDRPDQNTDLLLYYDFNQDGGDVIDRSAHGRTGARYNFGPDGDAWENTLGIFCLNPNGSDNDVAARFLKNYRHPFRTAPGTVNPANSARYLKLLMNETSSPWKQKGNVKNGNILTEWHVDKEKNNYLTLEDSYSGFESVIRDLMIYQTVELPAGEYTFIADRDGDTYYYNWLTEGTYVAAAAGDELPLTDDLPSHALAWTRLSENNAVSFMIDEPTTVSLGLIANMSDKKCVAVGKFILKQRRLIMGDGGEIVGIKEPMLTAEQTLEAAGGIGAINIRVNKPQTVAVTDLSGKIIFRDWLDFDARIPVKRGVYIVNKQKVLVK